LKWRKNDWKNSSGEEVKNRDLVRRIRSELEKRENHSKDSSSSIGIKSRTRPKFVHVKAHSGIHGNEMADQLAVRGAQMKQVPKDEWVELEPPHSDSEEYGEFVGRGRR